MSVSLPCRHPLLLTLALGLCCAVAGASEHLPATALRGLVLGLCAWHWPSRRTLPGWAWAPVAIAAAATALAWLPVAHLGLALQASLHVGAAAIVYLSAAGGSAAAPALGGALAWVGLGEALICLAQALLHPATRTRGSFFSPNDVAALLAPLLVATLIRARARAANGVTPTGAITTALLAAALATTGSRGGCLGAALGAACLLPGTGRRIQLGTLGLGALSLGLALARRLRDVGDIYAYSRGDIWRAVLRCIDAAPWGVGLGNGATALRAAGVPLTGWVRYPHVANHAHSEPLQIWLEGGLPALLAILLTVATLAWALLQLPAADRRQHLAMLCSLLPSALTGDSLRLPPVALLAALAAGATVAAAARVDAAHTGQAAAAKSTTWARAACLACWALAWPGALGAAGQQASAWARARGDAAGARQAAQLALWATPWSLQAALAALALDAGGQDAVAQAEDLLALADAFPQNDAPLRRAAQLLATTVPPTARGDARQQIIADFWWQIATRAGHDGWAWSEAGRWYLLAGVHQTARDAGARALAEEPHCARAHALLAGLSTDPEDAAAHREAMAAAIAQAPAAAGYAAQVLRLDPDMAQALAGL